MEEEEDIEKKASKQPALRAAIELSMHTHSVPRERGRTNERQYESKRINGLICCVFFFLVHVA